MGIQSLSYGFNVNVLILHKTDLFTAGNWLDTSAYKLDLSETTDAQTVAELVQMNVRINVVILSFCMTQDSLLNTNSDTFSVCLRENAGVL